MSKILDTRGMSERCGVHPNTIRAWINSEDLPARKLSGQWRITEDALNEWLGDKLAA